MFIGIAGPIGAGKTTLTHDLARSLGYHQALEPVETNPYLSDFYEDMARLTFPMQMFLLAKRFQQHQEVVWSPAHQDSNVGGVVQDRTIYEDTIFAAMHHRDGIMSDRDYEVYTSHFQIMTRYLVYPDILVYLRVPPGLAAERIKARGRAMEREIPMAYLQDLHQGYEEFIEEMKSHTAVLELDWSEYMPGHAVAEQVLGAMSRKPYARSLRRI